MVRQLEHSVDTAEGNPLDVGELPTGDELAAELERYLRDEREDTVNRESRAKTDGAPAPADPDSPLATSPSIAVVTVVG